MFIQRNTEILPKTVAEDESEDSKEIKAVCEVHAGNIFVQLHFKAMEKVPKDIKLVNTIVTTDDESSAQFRGCGKHVIAVRAMEDDLPLTKDKAT